MKITRLYGLFPFSFLSAPWCLDVDLPQPRAPSVLGPASLRHSGGRHEILSFWLFITGAFHYTRGHATSHTPWRPHLSLWVAHCHEATPCCHCPRVKMQKANPRFLGHLVLSYWSVWRAQVVVPWPFECHFMTSCPFLDDTSRLRLVFHRALFHLIYYVWWIFSHKFHGPIQTAGLPHDYKSRLVHDFHLHIRCRSRFASIGSMFQINPFSQAHSDLGSQS